MTDNETFIKKNFGYCHCCRSEVTFSSRKNWLRDYYRCSQCYSIPRQRHIQHILDKYFPCWESKKIHESSPSNNLISFWCEENYSSSQFFPGVSLGSSTNNVRCENLESLTYPDNVFDIFITQDVFEHIHNPDKAICEIMRVLKPGGAHVFTAPKHKQIRNSYPRNTIYDGQIIHLKEEKYHGNPVGDGRALVTWDYGDDFESLLCKWSGFPTVTYITRDDSLGLDGEYLEVFVIRKI
jgi:SAM-dependent methyltransferase